MNFHALKTAGAITGVSTGIGSVIGILDQATDVENGIDSNTPQAYANSVKRYMGYCAMTGLGLYGLTHMSSGKLFGISAGIGAGIGVYKGIKNQIYASNRYKDAYADPYSFLQSGTRFGAVGLMAGSGVYGGVEVARRIAKGVL